MENKFHEIKKEYKSFYNSFLRKGNLPMGDTDVGFWGAAATDDLFELFKKIKLQNFNSFLDLGSGDGKVTAIASLFTKAEGIEYDQDLHNSALKIKKKLGLKTKLTNADFIYHDLSKYDIIFINPDKSFSRGLERKLIKEFKGTLVVYNHIYKPFNLKKGRTFWTDQTPSTLYTV